MRSQQALGRATPGATLLGAIHTDCHTLDLGCNQLVEATYTNGRSMPELHSMLMQAATSESPWSAITIDCGLTPAGPDGSKVAPPTYPTSPDRDTPYLIETRWMNEQEQQIVLLDSNQSQANRCELALKQAALEERVDLPMFSLNQVIEGDAGTHRVRITSLDMPHRYADAYLRDSMLDGTDFDKTDLGKQLRMATSDNATALFEREPYSLVYGAWDSHRPGRQAKFPRLYDSTVIGLDPMTGVRQGGRLDPLNLTGATKSGDDGWEYAAPGEKKPKKGEKLSEIGHGNALDSGAAPGHVAISSARRLAQLHLSALHGVRFGDDVSQAATTAARGALIALALLGDRLAFDRASVYLRSGCSLARVSEKITFVRPDGDDETITLTIADAIELFREAVQAAADAGMVMADDVIELAPKQGLADAISFAYTKAEADE